LPERPQILSENAFGWARVIVSAEIFHLPASIAPRGLNVHQVAEYIGISAPTFLLAVAAGRYPKPIPFGRRDVWDKKAVDLAMDRESGIMEVSAKPAHSGTDDVDEMGVLLRANIAKGRRVARAR
jgi:predicted DNA-binding transcriptional regulator AlpA